MSVRPVWEEKPSILGQLGKGTVLTLVTAAVLVPLWVVLVTSLSSSKTINAAGATSSSRASSTRPPTS